MDSRQWSRVREVFEAALDVDAERRVTWLAETCSADDPEIRRHVERLLKADSGDGEEAGLVDLDRDAAWGDLVGAPLEGVEIGPYRIERRLASGGMANVYLATQSSPARRVALKIVHLGSSSQAIARFRLEASFLARLDHPNIAKVIEAGVHATTLGTMPFSIPYLALEYVEGSRSFVEHAAAANLDTAGRIELFLQVCDAVQHGHSRGVIHRDLKPSNILVDGEGRVRIIDFGIAHQLFDRHGLDLRTASGEVLGTPDYMSPEQLAGDSAAVDTRSDVYSLGVALFELLAGERPFATTLRRLHEDRTRIVPRLSARRRDLRGDLDHIVSRCLATEPDRRYPTVAALSDDLRRYLRDEPVSAAPPDLVDRTKKLIRRNPIASALTAALVVAIAVGFTSTVIALQRARFAGRQALEAKARAEHEAAVSDATAQFFCDALADGTPYDVGRHLTVLQTLESLVPRIDESFPNEPMIAGRIHDTYSKVMTRFGRLPEAREHEEKALRLAIAARGPDDYRVDGIRMALSGLISQTGDTERALAMSEEAIGSIERKLGADSDLMQEARAIRAHQFAASGRFDEARRLLLPTLEIPCRTRVQRMNRVRAESQLSEYCRRIGAFGDAVMHGDAALAHAAEAFEDHSPWLSYVRTIAGLAHLMANDPFQARALIEEAYVDGIEAFGPDSPALHTLLGAMGAVEEIAGDRLRGASWYHRAADAAGHIFGRHHPVAAAYRCYEGRVLEAAGRTHEAEAIAADIHASATGRFDDPRCESWVRVVLGRAAAGRSDLVCAHEHAAAAESLQSDPALRGPEWLRARHLIALIAVTTREFDEAAAAYRDVVARLGEEFGPQSAKVAVPREQLMAIEFVRGRYAAASETAADVVRYSASPVESAKRRWYLVLALVLADRVDEARVAYEEALKEASFHLGPGNQELLLLNAAGALLADELDAPSEADELFEPLLQSFRFSNVTIPPATPLGALVARRSERLEASGRREAARELRRFLE